MDMPGFRLMSSDRHLSDACNVPLDLVANILKYERPGLKCRIQRLHPQALAHFLVPLSRPNAELNNMGVDFGKMDTNLFPGEQAGSEFGVGKDIANFSECLGDLGRHLLVVQSGLEEELHGTPHESGVLRIGGDERVYDGLVLYHFGRRPPPPRHGHCRGPPPAGSLGLIFALILGQHIQDILD